MKNSDQRLFIVVFFFSFMSVRSTSAMIISESQEHATQEQDHTVQQKLSLLHVEIPTRIKKTAPQQIKQKRSTESPVGMTYSASWPDFSEYRPDTPLADRRSSALESQSAHPADRKKSRAREDSAYFEYKANDAAELVKILRRNPKRLQYFLEKLTPQTFNLLLSAYSSDFLYYCIRDKIILDAIDRAIRHNKFMSLSEPCSLKIVLPAEPITAECDFDELVGDVTILMFLAQRGLTALIQLSLANKYIKNLNVINDEKTTALDYANKAYMQTNALQEVRGLTPNQRVRFRHEFARLEGCIKFLREQGALTGQEVLAGKIVRRALNRWVKKQALEPSMKKLQIQDKQS